ncbi:hypothetical protein E2562_006798 [Oryza meyeriana var. granulata]|uniref:Sulfotransferase n=1 Tax=Oryza meyeriana var. granulata TaxID=110450 RepID=A0A6G1C4Y1_9ORYZ|nr:hypothetical protein E2562_006798 [Oryza meyeriana var. granulata]
MAAPGEVSGGNAGDAMRGVPSAASTFAFSSHGGDGDVFAPLPSPRLLSTHLPYSHLLERITANSSGCRIVYICRDPKDTIVSWWLFINKIMATEAAGANKGSKKHLPLAPYTVEEELDLFCDGRSANGPYWCHVLEYWEESQRRPEKVLFLRYEEMLREPTRSVKRLAVFMGCPFSGEEEADGVADAIVNKTGVTDINVRNEEFFRKGVSGDWSNHLSQEMAARLDMVVEHALRGSGFSFAAADGGHSV